MVGLELDVDQAGLKLAVTLLPLPLKCWSHRYEPAIHYILK